MFGTSVLGGGAKVGVAWSWDARIGGRGPIRVGFADDDWLLGEVPDVWNFFCEEGRDSEVCVVLGSPNLCSYLYFFLRASRSKGAFDFEVLHWCGRFASKFWCWCPIFGG